MMALITVGIGDCKVSKDPSDVLVTHALGSCIGVVLYDPIAKVAGLLHYMLPDSTLDPDKAAQRPFVFADTGIPLLLKNTCQLGAVKSRSVVMVAGGAQMLDPNGTFNIGQRNHVAMRKIFWKAGVIVRNEEIGGTSSRTMRIDVACGRVQLRTSAGSEQEMVVNSKKIGAGDGLQHTHRR
jgi:chemotaxis protein CheD